jgi:hypothetical protein
MPSVGLRWLKSSASGGTNCVEVGFTNDGDHVYIRDSKAPDDAYLRFTKAEWEAFLVGVAQGQFDL